MICAPYKELRIPKNLNNPNFDRALEWLKGDNWKNLPDGKTEIDGSKVYVLRVTKQTKPPAQLRYESHRVYVDVQLAFKGSGIILVCAREGMKVIEPYSAEKDVDFLAGEPALVHRAALAFPLATVLFPWDVHMPDATEDDKGSDIEKITIKVAL